MVQAVLMAGSRPMFQLDTKSAADSSLGILARQEVGPLSADRWVLEDTGRSAMLVEYSILLRGRMSASVLPDSLAFACDMWALADSTFRRTPVTNRLRPPVYSSEASAQDKTTHHRVLAKQRVRSCPFPKFPWSRQKWENICKSLQHSGCTSRYAHSLLDSLPQQYTDRMMSNSLVFHSLILQRTSLTSSYNMVALDTLQPERLADKGNRDIRLLHTSGSSL